MLYFLPLFSLLSLLLLSFAVFCRVNRAKRLVLAVSALLLAPSAAVAAPLAELRTDELKISLASLSSEQFRLSIAPTNGQASAPKPEVTALNDPRRLVIDVPGFKSKTSRNVKLEDRLISGVRLGIHPDKTRLVIDLRGPNEPTYSVVPVSHGGASGVNIDFALSAAAAAPAGVAASEDTALAALQPPAVVDSEKEAVQEVAKKETAKGKDDESSTAVADKIKKELQETEAKMTPPATDSQTDVAKLVDAPGGRVVRAVYFQTSEDDRSPSLVVDAGGLDSYALNEKKDGLYELTLENTKLAGKHLTHPQFPPDTFRGFDVAVAREEGPNVLIRVYVEEGMKLAPYVAKKQLWLKAANESAKK